jgi:hypothetical protein
MSNRRNRPVQISPWFFNNEIRSILQEVRIDRPLSLEVALMRLEELGFAIMDYAKNNPWFDDLFRRSYGVSMRDFLNKCIQERRKELSSSDDAYIRYRCWVALMERVGLIIRSTDRTRPSMEEVSEGGE